MVLEAKSKLGLLVLVFVALIIGIVLLETLADPISEFDNINLHTNESITFAAGSVVLSSTPVLSLGIAGSVITSGTILSNSTNSTIGTTNYQTFSNGSLILSGGASDDLGASSLANFTYSSYSRTFIGNTSAITLLQLVGLFFALAIVLIVVMFVIRNFEDLKNELGL